MDKALLPLILLLTSCGEPSKDGTVIRYTDPAGRPPAAAANGEKQSIDPICGMVRTASWTNWSLYEGDTVWFCAAVEKKAFDAHPEKYARKIQK